MREVCRGGLSAKPGNRGRGDCLSERFSCQLTTIAATLEIKMPR